jgi:hypothetical protein
MSITYGYFNSVNGDRKYNADQMSQYFKGLISNGVFANIGGAMAVIADGQSMTVNVSTGRAVIDCKWIENDAAYPITINQAHATLPRYTAVVVQLDAVNRLIRITTKDGTPASTPAQPTIDTSIELCLAMILVPAGSSTIIQSRVTDKRGTSLCLWVTGLITQLNSNQLFLQWQEQFDIWFAGLTQDLNVNTYVRRFQKRVVLSGSNVIALDMTGYTYEATDIINVYVNGLFAVAGTDFTLDTSGATPTVTTNATASGGNVVVIDVMKSIVGFPALGTESLNTLTTESDVPIEA